MSMRAHRRSSATERGSLSLIDLARQLFAAKQELMGALKNLTCYLWNGSLGLGRTRSQSWGDKERRLEQNFPGLGTCHVSPTSAVPPDSVASDPHFWAYQHGGNRSSMFPLHLYYICLKSSSISILKLRILPLNLVLLYYLNQSMIEGHVMLYRSVWKYKYA